MNTRNLGRKISIASIALVLVIAMVSCFAFAEPSSGVKASELANSVVNTTTDQTQVTSPFISVVSNVQSSVVGINNYVRYSYSNNYGFGRGFFGYGYGNPSSADDDNASTETLYGKGSGVCIADNYILTNYHVVEDASKITVTTLGDSETELPATVVASDEDLDLAVVYVENLGLQPVQLGDSDQLQVGEWAICIGNPLSDTFAGTVTVGIVSALNREISTSGATDQYGLKTTNTNAMIQTDAAINAGNSGGGLFNTLGQLMGIPSMKYTNSYYSSTTVEGIGLAIPVNSAKDLIAEALSADVTKIADAETTTETPAEQPAQDTKTTADSHPRLGISAQTLSTSNNAVMAGVLPNGAMIAAIEENSPASAAGLAVNDIIVQVDDTVITSVSQIQDLLKEKSAGDKLTVKVYRVPNLDQATTVDEIETGEYMDIEVMLTDFA